MQQGNMAFGPTAVRVLWVAIVVFGAVANLLALSGPVFMVLVYDRVLPSRSGASLFVLFALVTFLFAVMIAVDSARSRLLVVLAAAWQARHEDTAFGRCMTSATGVGAVTDVDRVAALMRAPAMMAVLDLPWTMVFVLGLMAVHPVLGGFALAGGALQFGLTWAAQGRGAARAAPAAAERLVGALLTGDGVLRRSAAVRRRWRHLRAQERAEGFAQHEVGGQVGALSRGFRLFMQSAMLALGAWLVIDNALSAGMMIAASVMLGRALGPVEQIAAALPMVRAAWASYRRVRTPGLIDAPLPTGADGVRVSGALVFAGPNRAPILQCAGFSLARGQALAVIGPSGSGKSVLARVLAGLQPAAGQVVAPRRLGYLAQHPAWFPGSLRENLVALTPEVADLSPVLLPLGVDVGAGTLSVGLETPMETAIEVLPAGTVQRLAIARAFHGVPDLVVLDEPAGPLDAAAIAGLQALIRAHKARGGMVIVMTNRLSGISECDSVLVLEGGVQTAIGPRDEILRSRLRPHRPPDRPAALVGGLS